MSMNPVLESEVYAMSERRVTQKKNCSKVLVQREFSFFALYSFSMAFRSGFSNNIFLHFFIILITYQTFLQISQNNVKIILVRETEKNFPFCFIYHL